MKVELAKTIGFCGGVALAFKRINEIRQLHQEANIFVYGELVHNSDALKELTKLNIQTINIDYNKTFLENIAHIKENDILVFSAHGHIKENEEILKARKIKFYDLTCPKVLKIHHQIIKKINEGYKIIYIGKKNHPEAISSVALSNNIYLYDLNEKSFNYREFNTNKILIINQTTLSPREINRLEDDIKKHLPNAKNIASICFSSKRRQEELENIPPQTDLLIIIGAKNSSNSNSLYALAKTLYPYLDIYFVMNKEELISYDLTRKKNAYLLSGASTPLNIIYEIKEYLEKI